MKRLLLLAAVVLAPLGLSATAQARVAHDPCTGTNHHLEKVDDGTTRVCYGKFEMPKNAVWQDPTSDAEARCPNGSHMSWDGDWDYMTDNGEWITWALTSNYPRGRNGYTVGATPWYINWAPWQWSVRTFIFCHPYANLAAFKVTDGIAKGPDDALVLDAGDDITRGTQRDDEIAGLAGDDRLYGGAGDDVLLGGKGDDHLYGGAGSDELFDNQGRDVILAGPGNDRISVKDGNRDIVDCGPGEDIAIGDPIDVFRGCEHVYTTPENTPARPPKIS
jgi:hypothetical protein